MTWSGSSENNAESTIGPEAVVLWFVFVGLVFFPTLERFDPSFGLRTEMT